MKILFLTVGDETMASSRTRAFQYIPHLVNYGISCRIVVYDRPSPWRWKPLIGKLAGAKNHLAAYLRLLLFLPFCDIFFIQKVLLPAFFLNLIRLCGKKMVFDFDDAIYIDEFSAETDRRQLRPFENAVRASSLVVLENDAAAAFAGRFNNNILKITGPIDTDRYRPAGTTGPVCVGWIGHPATTCYLKRLLGVLDELRKLRPETKFLFIGATSPDLGDFGQYSVNWSLETEVELLSKIDIGLMPLADNEWTRGKGGYKLLQYMAMGIPSLASPVEINRELTEDGRTGFLPDSPDAWLKNLTTLLDNPDLRRELGKNARDRAVKKYSFYAAAPLLKKNLETILKFSR
ncbi:MAG: glycosyltransferase family 4 protein [Elusimicrobia bacterium]|nr:glycosyltransferase family 4 protein [Elusimicrobiota bacterium]